MAPQRLSCYIQVLWSNKVNIHKFAQVNRENPLGKYLSTYFNLTPDPRANACLSPKLAPPTQRHCPKSILSWVGDGQLLEGAGKAPSTFYFDPCLTFEANPLGVLGHLVGSVGHLVALCAE